MYLKKIVLICAVLLALVVSVYARPVAEASNTTAAMTSTPITVSVPAGSSFIQVSNAGGIAGSRFYLYVPSELYNPGPMMTPVIYVYGNSPYTDGNTAWTALTRAGLNTIAEAEHAAIIMVNPVGSAWGKADVDVFEAMMAYIFNLNGEVKLTWHNLQYVIGEGTGATFVNNYLTGHCKRIAALMTIGGEFGDPAPLYPLPAYIVGGSQKAVDYFLNTNDGSPILPTSGRVNVTKTLIRSKWKTVEAADKTTYVYTANPVKQVIVSKSGVRTLDAALIADCWETLFRYTARADLVNNFWQYTDAVYNEAVYTLLQRPNYKAAGMQVIKVEGINNGIFDSNADNYWYEFIPKAAQEAMSRNSGEKFPMILCLHGGNDHPVYEAESIGWAQLCIDNNIIMVSPNPSAVFETNVEKIMALVDYMISKYPVDVSRIYAAGFSMGAGSTLVLSNAYPERFAAVSPMSCHTGPFYTALLNNVSQYSYDMDLPICVVGQGLETESTDFNYQYVWYDAVKEIFTLNEIPQYTGALDFTKYPYWGFPIQDEVRHSPPAGLAIWQGCVYDAAGVPMVSFAHSEQTTHTLPRICGDHLGLVQTIFA